MTVFSPWWVIVVFAIVNRSSAVNVNLRQRCVGDLASCSSEHLWNSYNENHMEIEVINRVLSSCMRDGHVQHVSDGSDDSMRLSLSPYTVYTVDDDTRYTFKEHPLCAKALATCNNPEVTDEDRNRVCRYGFYDLNTANDPVDRFKNHKIRTKPSKGPIFADFGHYIARQQDLNLASTTTLVLSEYGGCLLPSYTYYQTFYDLLVELNKHVEGLHRNRHRPPSAYQALLDNVDDALAASRAVVDSSVEEMLDPVYYPLRYAYHADYYFSRGSDNETYALSVEPMLNTVYNVIDPNKRSLNTPLQFGVDVTSTNIIDPYKSNMIDVSIRPYCNVAYCNNPWESDFGLNNMIAVMQSYGYFDAPTPPFVGEWYQDLEKRLLDRHPINRCKHKTKMKILRRYGDSATLAKDISSVSNGGGPTIERDKPCIVFALDGGSVRMMDIELDSDRCIAEVLASNKYVMSTALLGVQNVPFYSMAQVVVTPVDNKEVYFKATNMQTMYVDLSNMVNHGIYAYDNYVKVSNASHWTFDVRRFVHDNVKHLGLANHGEVYLDHGGVRNRLVEVDGEWRVSSPAAGSYIDSTSQPDDYFVTVLRDRHATEVRTELSKVSIHLDNATLHDLYLDHLNPNTKLRITNSPSLELDHVYFHLDIGANFTDMSYYNGTLGEQTLKAYRNELRHAILGGVFADVHPNGFVNLFGLYDQHTMRDDLYKGRTQNRVSVDFLTGVVASYVYIATGILLNVITFLMFLGIKFKDVIEPRQTKENKVIHSLLTSLIADKVLDNTVTSGLAQDAMAMHAKLD